jgi:hypothetical protein
MRVRRADADVGVRGLIAISDSGSFPEEIRVRRVTLSMTTSNDRELAAVCERMQQEREASLRRFGHLSDSVLSRLRPILIGDAIYAWPSNAIGPLRLVRREHSVLLVTDGLSNPWDPSLHDDVPDWTFGFELAVELPLSTFDDASDAAIAVSWAPLLLWSATDWVVAERADLMSRVANSDLITHALPPVGGLEHLVASNGFMGGIIGIPIVGNVIGTSVSHCSDPHVPGEKTSLLTLKLLTAAEYDWALGTPDASRVRVLVERFLASGVGHLSDPHRASVV